MQKSTILSIVSSLVLIGGIFFISDQPTPSGDGAGAQIQNVEIRDGAQYVTILAKGGYFPRVSEIKSGLPTKLIVKTDGTYDCSASLVIRSLGFQKILQPIGEEIIDLGVPEPGGKVQGVCGMGMFSFQIQVD